MTLNADKTLNINMAMRFTVIFEREDNRQWNVFQRLFVKKIAVKFCRFFLKNRFSNALLA